MTNRKMDSIVAGYVSLVSNSCLMIAKVMIGLLYGSQALFADGIHNGADVVASVASLGSMRVSNRPADREHPYGHGKAEVIAAGTVGIVLTISAIWILARAIESLSRPLPGETEWIPLLAAVVSLAWKQGLYLYTIRVGRKYSSKGLMATAYDHLSDVYASLATVVGIGLAHFGRQAGVPGLAYADPIAGILVALLVCKLAYRMGRESIDTLMERAVPEEKMALYAREIMATPGVKHIDRLRARELGHYVLVDVRLSVPGEWTVQQGHDVCHSIKCAVMEADRHVEEVLVHLNPWYGDQAGRS